MHKVVVCLAVLILPVAASGATWYVPGDSDTIQGAVDMALAGDEILVGPGDYAESLVVDKSVIVQSTAGSGSTRIIGSGSSTDVVRVAINNVHLAGFEVRGGRYGVNVDAGVTGLGLVDIVVSETGSSQVYLSPDQVESVVSQIGLVGHASGSLDAILIRQGTLLESATWPVPPPGFVYQFATSHDLTIAGDASPVLHLLPETIIKF